MTARLTLRIGLLAIVAFALGLVAARWLSQPRPVPLPATASASVYSPPQALPALDLVDQDGRPFTAESLRGHWTFVFFGFTQCPDVCPTTLTVLKQVRQQLADLPPAQQPRVLLVTVDPERDTAARLRDYVRFFDPSFGAVTGAPVAIQQVATAFAVPYQKVELPQGGYTMDHGAGVFVVAPTAATLAYSSPPLQPQTLAADYRKLVRYYAALQR